MQLNWERGRLTRRYRPLADYVLSAVILMLRGADFQTCRIADFQVGSAALRPAGLETRGTADLEVCATLNRYLAENIWAGREDPSNGDFYRGGATCWRDASQSDRDGRAPIFNCMDTYSILQPPKE